MKISDLAAVTGVAAETIRYYEQQGLLPAPQRQANNYRHYSASHAERLVFIRHCRHLDMTLDEIRTLLQVQDTPASSCAQVNAVIEEHIGHVVQRRRELQQLEAELRRLRTRCQEAGQPAQCGILAELARMPDEITASGGRGL